MLYKLLNKLFGWDYVHWQTCGFYGIAKVRVDGDGRPYIYRYWITNCCDRLEEYPKDNLIWLTCKREKYFPSQISN